MTPIIPESQLPAGPPPDPATQRAVAAAARRETACRNAGAYEWPAILGRIGMLATPSPLASPASPAAATARPGIVPIPVPAILRMTALPDGRVGVLPASDLYGLGLKMYIVFAPYAGQWIADDSGQVASDAWLLASYRGPILHDLELVFSDEIGALELGIPANRPVHLTIHNEGSRPHHFAIPDLGGSVSVGPGQSTTIRIVEPAGPHRYTLDIAPQRGETVAGVIWAVPSGATTPQATPRRPSGRSLQSNLTGKSLARAAPGQRVKRFHTLKEVSMLTSSAPAGDVCVLGRSSTYS